MKTSAAIQCVILLGGLTAACAVGVTSNDGSGGDGGSSPDSATPAKDGGAKDSQPGQDSSPGADTGPTCNAPNTLCGSDCVDTKTDLQHCGDCATACMGGQTCSMGLCCNSNETVCNGSCTDTSSDVSNCGGCGQTCAGVCNGGSCVVSSIPPQGNCADSLCTDNFDPQTPGCDPTGCVNKVCAADFFCCVYAWDSGCAAEVAQYCSPYTCN